MNVIRIAEKELCNYYVTPYPRIAGLRFIFQLLFGSITVYGIYDMVLYGVTTGGVISAIAGFYGFSVLALKMLKSIEDETYEYEE